MDKTHILYSFRRCPYAMRARMAIAISDTHVSLREVVLRDKPEAMLEASPKGTVPVIVTADGQVIDESLDVMHWALSQNDPEGWLSLAPEAQSTELITRNDGPFKAALDRYKYSNRYKEEQIDAQEQRSIGLTFLKDLDTQLAKTNGFLFGDRRALADVAIFPFIRQFANTDREWFDAQPLPDLQRWLAHHLESDLFKSVMSKYTQWEPGHTEPVFPIPASAA